MRRQASGVMGEGDDVSVELRAESREKLLQIPPLKGARGMFQFSAQTSQSVVFGRCNEVKVAAKLGVGFFELKRRKL